MVMKAWRCSCGGDHVTVGHEGPLLQERISEIEKMHSGPGHRLVPTPVDDVAPVPVS